MEQHMEQHGWDAPPGMRLWKFFRNAAGQAHRYRHARAGGGKGALGSAPCHTHQSTSWHFHTRQTTPRHSIRTRAGRGTPFAPEHGNNSPPKKKPQKKGLEETLKRLDASPRAFKNRLAKYGGSGLS
jgi:hypothetical protein